MAGEDFWQGTPAEHGRFLDGASLARRDALDALTVGAWQGAAFERQKRLPDLQRLLARRAERTERDSEPDQGGESKEQLRAKWRQFFDRARVARGGR
jgi:hypothetical protein